MANSRCLQQRHISRYACSHVSTCSPCSRSTWMSARMAAFVSTFPRHTPHRSPAPASQEPPGRPALGPWSALCHLGGPPSPPPKSLCPASSHSEGKTQHSTCWRLWLAATKTFKNAEKCPYKGETLEALATAAQPASGRPAPNGF